MTRRAGVTLVEVALFSLLGLVFVMFALQLFRSSARDAARLDRHLHGLQSVQALLDRLTADLAGTYRFEKRAAGLAYEMNVSADGRTLELFAFDATNQQPEQPVAADGTITPIRLDRITYRFDPADHCVTRQVAAGKPEPIRSARYLSVRFEHPATGTAPLDGRDQLLLAVDWVPEPELKAPRADRTGVLAFRTTLGLPLQAASRLHPAALLDPTSKFIH